MFIKVYSEYDFLIFNKISLNFKEIINDKGQGVVILENNEEQKENIKSLNKNKFYYYILEFLNADFRVLRTYYIKNITEKEDKTEIIITDFNELLENEIRLDFSKLDKETIQRMQENANPREFLTFCFNEFLESVKFAPFNLHLKDINLSNVAKNKKIKDLGDYEGQVIIVDFLKYIKTYLNYFNLILVNTINKNYNNHFTVNYAIVKENPEPLAFLSSNIAINVETKTAPLNHTVASIKYNTFITGLTLEDATVEEYNNGQVKKRVLVNKGEDLKKRKITDLNANQVFQSYEHQKSWERMSVSNLTEQQIRERRLPFYKITYIERDNKNALQLFNEKKGLFALLSGGNLWQHLEANNISSPVYLEAYASNFDNDNTKRDSQIYKLEAVNKEVNYKYFKVIESQEYKKRPQLEEVNYFLTTNNEIVKKSENNERINGVRYPLKTKIIEEQFLAEAQIKAVYELYKNRYMLGATFKNVKDLKVGDKIIFNYLNSNYVLPITEMEIKVEKNEITTFKTVGNKRDLLTQKIKDLNNKIIKNSVASNENAEVLDNKKELIKHNTYINDLKTKEAQSTQKVRTLETSLSSVSSIANENKRKLQQLQQTANTSKPIKEHRINSSLTYGKTTNIKTSHITIKPEKVVGAFLEISVGEQGSSWNNVKNQSNKFITPIIIARNTTQRYYSATIENGDGYFSLALLEVHQYSQDKANDLYITLKRANRTQSSSENSMGRWSCNVLIYYTD